MPSFFPSSSRGFTLIELLVVVFIISLTAGFLLINVSFDSAEDKIKEDANRLMSLLRFAHEQSIIRAEEYGLRFHQTGYRFMTLEKEEWIELSSDRHLTSYELENNMEFELYIEDIEVVLNDAEDEAELIKQEQEALKNNADSNENESLIEDIHPTEIINENESENEESKMKPHVFLLSSGELSPAFSVRIRIPGIDVYSELKGSINGEYEILKADEL